MGRFGFPLESMVFVPVDLREAEEFVTKGGEADDAAAFVSEVGLGFIFFADEMRTSEEEGFEALFGFGTVGVALEIESVDEIGDRSLGGFSFFIGNHQRDRKRAAFWGEVDPAFFFTFANDFTNGRVARLGAKEKKGGVNVARLRLNGDDGLVFLRVLGARKELEGSFRESDSRSDIDSSGLEIDGDSGKFKIFQGVIVDLRALANEATGEGEDNKAAK